MWFYVLDFEFTYLKEFENNMVQVGGHIAHLYGVTQCATWKWANKCLLKTQFYKPVTNASDIMFKFSNNNFVLKLL